MNSPVSCVDGVHTDPGEAVPCLNDYIDSLGNHLGHVGADEGPPVPALNVEFLEAQPQHQLVEDPGGGHRIEA